MHTYKYAVLFVLLMILLAGCSSGKRAPETVYSYFLDLKNLDDDQAFMTLQVEGIMQDTVSFMMPAFVPGYYDSVYYGNMVSDLRAADRDGNELDIIRTDDNSWQVVNGQNLHTISYKVGDVQEENLTGYGASLSLHNFFERGMGYQLIPAASFGYIDGLEADSVHVSMIKPFGLSVSGARPIEGEGEEVEYSPFSIPDLYRYPVLFSNQQAVSFDERNVTVSVAWFSEGDIVAEEEILPAIREAMEVAGVYLDGDFPVNAYSYQFWFSGDESLNEIQSSNFNSSSVWVIPEAMVGEEDFPEKIREHAFRELFHLYAPQFINTWELRDFDFDSPVATKHLWMIEGTTEYLAQHVQVNRRLKTEQQFEELINEKLARAAQYDHEIPLTELSRNVYKTEDTDASEIIKARGFIVSLLLDLRLRGSSYGQRGLKQMMQVLAREYGDSRPFYDDELFEIMSNYTNLNLNSFYQQYIAGTGELPLADAFKQVGYIYDPATNTISKADYPGQEDVDRRLSWLYGI